MNHPFSIWPSGKVDARSLLEAARKARLFAYAPYSGFKVGAALLTERGEVFLGCNIENSSYSLTVCAERVALFSALAAGSGKPAAIAVAGRDGVPCIPCGACLQVLAEFNPDFSILLDGESEFVIHRLSDLLPLQFRLERDNS
jgi:cytidine deaminase